MSTQPQLNGQTEAGYLTPRKIVSVLFHHPKIVLWSFGLILCTAMLLAISQPPLYRSQMTFFINLERTDPVVTADPNMVPKSVPGITDQAINSELQLMKSQDLLRSVVVACGLQNGQGQSLVQWVKQRLGKEGTADKAQTVAIAKATLRLQKAMSIDLIPKTSMIQISYASSDPELSAKVLRTYSDLYLKKHLAVRRPAGTFDFFKQEAERYHQQVISLEQELDNFTRENNISSLDVEQNSTLKKLTDLEVARHETQAAIKVTSQRIQKLRAQMAEVPPRFTTQVRKESGRPPDQLQTTLLTLELKRSELANVFQPGYPALVEVEKQIAEAKAALADSEQRTVVQETTDRDPAHEWLRIELEKAEVELVDLKSKDKAMAAMTSQFSDKAGRLNNLQVRHNDLSRSLKLAEAGYVTYHNKQEESRISDALDSQKILNVSVADSPSVPIMPSTIPLSLFLFVGLASGVIFSTVLAFGVERINSLLRTPNQVEQLLGVPVVAAIPERVD